MSGQEYLKKLEGWCNDAMIGGCSRVEIVGMLEMMKMKFWDRVQEEVKKREESDKKDLEKRNAN